ncbi:hypothetical protein [Nitrosomonas sp.]|uniref:hypothetical protein n=1 Tax=Nitrosomonas sp. TaxID=42353 RepID=UPI0025D85429|nr:hypothetical protein [Nitrosomonas sp.]MBV6447285.1 hypothetical protein [Nitrosomonas sp.]
MNNYEAIGRYHVAVKEARELISKRNNLLSRAASVLKYASDQPLPSQGIAKRCNFNAVQALLAEAQEIDCELMKVLEEIAGLAPIANEPVLELV